MTEKREPYSHVNADGTAKIRYKTRRDARRNSRRLMRLQPGLALREYGCSSCDGFHLTKAIPYVARA